MQRAVCDISSPLGFSLIFPLLVLARPFLALLFLGKPIALSPTLLFFLLPAQADLNENEKHEHRN